MKTLRAHVESSSVYNAFKHVFIFCGDSEERGLHKASMHIPANNYNEKEYYIIIKKIILIYTCKYFNVLYNTYQITSENVQHSC